VTLTRALSELGHRDQGCRRCQSALREKVQQVTVDGKISSFLRFTKGLRRRFGPRSRPAGMVPLAISSMEGLVMMSKLYERPSTFTGL
jgi:hypothetical protein